MGVDGHVTPRTLGHLDDSDSIGVTIVEAQPDTLTKDGHGRSIRVRPHSYAAGQGQGDGSLHEVKPVDLAVGLLKEMQVRNPTLDANRVDDVVLGVVSPVSEQGGDIAKTAALAAGYPETVAGVQLNRFCASGLEAVNQAASRVRGGFEDLIFAGGVESMSRVAMGSDGGAWASDPATALTTGFVPQGIGADLIATLEGWSREDVDAFAAESHHRAAKAWANGYYTDCIVPVKDINGLTVLDHDETIRPDTSVEGLAGLKPSFAGIGADAGFDDVALEKYHWVEKINHVHHAGNSSGIVDGAALMAIGSEQVGKDLGLTPRARIVSAAVSGADPTIMLTGPAPAARKALAKAGLRGRGHRPLRDQRGVRRGRHAVHARPGHQRRDHQRQRRRDRHGPPARRDRRDDPRHAHRRARSAATSSAAWPRSASAAAWASPRSSRSSDESRQAASSIGGRVATADRACEVAMSVSRPVDLRADLHPNFSTKDHE